MRNKDWKKKQKKVNLVVRSMNQNIYNDNLWLGRFHIHQTKSEYYKFSDGSGGILVVWLEFLDKKTGQTKIQNFEFCSNVNFFAWDLFEATNRFITEDCAVWENDDPRHNIVDYREVKKKC